MQPALRWFVPGFLGICLLANSAGAQDQVMSAQGIQLAPAQTEVVDAKCGSCHDLRSTGTASLFETQIAHYAWPHMPLRVWLASQHRPRLQTIDMTEADVMSISAFIASLTRRDTLAPAVIGPHEPVAGQGDAEAPAIHQPLPDSVPDRVLHDSDTMPMPQTWSYM